MRALLFQLRPAAMEAQRLAVALTRHAVAFESREGVRMQLSVEGERRLPVSVEAAMFRVAQEALNNIAKHARAGGVDLRLCIAEPTVSLTVGDDGPASTRSHVPAIDGASV